MKFRRKRRFTTGPAQSAFTPSIDRMLLRLLDARMVYVLWRPLFYCKCGISVNAAERLAVIDEAVIGKVYKVIALPFLFATFWEGLILLLTSGFRSCPPLRPGLQLNAGATEWRWWPGLTWVMCMLLIAEWITQAHVLIWLVTYHTEPQPFSLWRELYPHLRTVIQQLIHFTKNL